MAQYHVTTSDGALHHIAGFTAAEAMSKALDRNRGRTVLACFSGNVDMAVQHAGRITYEIPAHQPLPPKEDPAPIPSQDLL